MKLVLIGATAFCYLTSFAFGQDTDPPTCTKYNRYKDKCEEAAGCQFFGDKILPRNKCAPDNNKSSNREKEEECNKWTKRACDEEVGPVEKPVEKMDGKVVGLPVQKGWKGSAYCSIQEPGDVTNFKVVCSKATYLDFSIADCCVDGDHWQLKGKQWDRAPNTAVTTAPGPRNLYGVYGRIYNYDSPPENKGSMHALIECSYLHGTALYGAGSFIRFKSNANFCTVTKVQVEERIDRSP